VAEAIAGGMLAVVALRNGPGTTRALLPIAISPASVEMTLASCRHASGGEATGRQRQGFVLIEVFITPWGIEKLVAQGRLYGDQRADRSRYGGPRNHS
jgi:hypothetical protein